MTDISRKTMISRLVETLLLASLPLLALAETPEQQHARIQRLEHAVLAPCCYTEPVAIHQSEVALKMRLEIAKWVAAGKSDREIIDTYVGLYGGKVLVDPRTVPRGWTPFVPWLVLVLGAFAVACMLKCWRAVPGTTTASSTTEVPNLPDADDE